MPIKEIFIDLDDTLNQFTMEALLEVGCVVNQSNPMSSYDPSWGWDIVKAANALHPHRKFTAEAFWAVFFERSFWASLPRSDEFDFLVQESIKLVGRENITILSCPIEEPTCAAEKLEWIQEFCPRWMHRQYLLGPEKFRCAKPGALLIDDSDDNIERFCVKGGAGMLVPRPWNRLHKVKTMSHLACSFLLLEDLR